MLCCRNEKTFCSKKEQKEFSLKCRNVDILTKLKDVTVKMTDRGFVIKRKG